MSKTLVISGHPDYKSSIANRAILDEFHRLVPDAEIVYLDALYTHKPMNVELEQNRLLEADTIIMDFPFWWYGAPSLMHRYWEEVLLHSFAYGSKGKAMVGKKLIISITVGGSEESYTPIGKQPYSMDLFLWQFRAVGTFCNFDYRGEVISFGMTMFHPEDKAAVDAFYTKTKKHAAKLIAKLEN